MAVIGSQVSVLDRSGAQEVKCIRIHGGRKSVLVGDRVVVVVKKARVVRRRKKTVKSGEVHLALAVKCAGSVSRRAGYSVDFPETSFILIRKSDFSPLSARIVGSVSQDLRFKAGFLRILSMAYDIF